MKLLVKVAGTYALIIDYVGLGSGANAYGAAVVVMNGTLHTVRFSDIELLRVPKRLRKVTRRERENAERRLHEAADALKAAPTDVAH